MFVKGKSGNPAGRKKGKNAMDELRAAIKTEEKKHKRTLMQQFVARAYEDSSVMVALMRKILPDKKIQDVNLSGDVGVIFRFGNTKTDN